MKDPPFTPSEEPLLLTDQLASSPSEDPLPPLLLTDRVDDNQQRHGPIPLWRRRLLASAALAAAATVLLVQPNYRAWRVTGLFAVAVSPIPILDDAPGKAVLLPCLIAVAVALWPRRR